MSVFAEGRDTIRVNYIGQEETYAEDAAWFWFRDDEIFISKNTVNNTIADVLENEAYDAAEEMPSAAAAATYVVEQLEELDQCRMYPGRYVDCRPI